MKDWSQRQQVQRIERLIVHAAERVNMYKRNVADQGGPERCKPGLLRFLADAEKNLEAFRRELARLGEEHQDFSGS